MGGAPIVILLLGMFIPVVFLLLALLLDVIATFWMLYRFRRRV